VDTGCFLLGRGLVVRLARFLHGGHELRRVLAEDLRLPVELRRRRVAQLGVTFDQERGGGRVTADPTEPTRHVDQWHPLHRFAVIMAPAAALLDREAEILREHAAQLMAAMEKARKADDKPAAEKKAACVHKASTWRRTDRLVGRCNRWAMRTPYNQRTTENDAEVTCKRCLKSLKKGA